MPPFPWAGPHRAQHFMTPNDQNRYGDTCGQDVDLERANSV